MTNEERRRAFDLRLRGKTWNEIAAELNYSGGSYVERDIKQCVSGRRKKIPCQYPAIQNIIVSEYYGSVPAFAEACGVNYNTMHATLVGRNKKPSRYVALTICAKTGLTYKEAFGDDPTSL